MKAQLEKISSPLHRSFKAFRYRGERFDAPWHFHPEYELTYIVQSNGIRFVGDSVKEFENGDLVLLGANLPHCWKNMEQQIQTAESIVVQWKNDLLGDGWLDTSEFLPIKTLLESASRGIRFDTPNNTEVVRALDTMPELSPFERMLTLLSILNRLAASKNYEFLSADNFAPKLNRNASKNIDRIQNFVAEHYRDNITLGQVSDLTAMSEETFCRFFKRTFNKSFFTFLNEYKIKLACKLLIESNKQVSEIAFECGYESLPFFYRQFKKFMGCSPLVYQKKYARVFT